MSLNALLLLRETQINQLQGQRQAAAMAAAAAEPLSQRDPGRTGPQSGADDNDVGLGRREAEEAGHVDQSNTITATEADESSPRRPAYEDQFHTFTSPFFSLGGGASISGRGGLSSAGGASYVGPLDPAEWEAALRTAGSGFLRDDDEHPRQGRGTRDDSPPSSSAAAADSNILLRDTALIAPAAAAGSDPIFNATADLPAPFLAGPASPLTQVCPFLDPCAPSSHPALEHQPTRIHRHSSSRGATASQLYQSADTEQKYWATDLKEVCPGEGVSA